MNSSLPAGSSDPRADSGHNFNVHTMSEPPSKPQLENSIEIKYHHPSTIMASPQLQRFLGQCTQTEQASVEVALHTTLAKAITRDIQIRSVFIDIASRLIRPMVYATAKEKNTAIESIKGCGEVWEQEYEKIKSEWVLELVVALGGSKQNLLDDERDRQKALNERAYLRIEQILSSLVGFHDKHRKTLESGIKQYQFVWDAINAGFADMMNESIMELAKTLHRESLQRALSEISLPPL